MTAGCCGCDLDKQPHCCLRFWCQPCVLGNYHCSKGTSCNTKGCTACLCTLFTLGLVSSCYMCFCWAAPNVDKEPSSIFSGAPMAIVGEPILAAYNPYEEYEEIKEQNANYGTNV